ncbi:MAG: DUF1579 domain-containing protein [Planctomycetota bacterium]
MKTRLVLGSVAGLMLVVTSQVVSQEKRSEAAKPQAAGQQEKQAGEADMRAMMQQYMEMTAPGPQHEKMAKTVGTWDAVCMSCMAPEAPPIESKGEAVFSMMLDGRYLRQDYEGNFMGMPFKGVGIEAYDTFKKEYVSIWMDSMMTSILVLRGTASADGKTVTLTGKMDDPTTGQMDKDCKTIARYISDDKMVFEMYDKTPEGKEFRCMEITYSRRK